MATMIPETPVMTPVAPQAGLEPFATLKGHQYMSLTTYRKTGQPVATPVWFVLDADRVYMVTDLASGKVKRLRRNRQVLVAPCTATGKPLGPGVPAEARLLPTAESASAHRALIAKYGWMWRLFEWWWRVRHQDAVFLEIVPSEKQI